MGIPVEFNPEMALRSFSEYQKGNRKKEECLPEKIEQGKTYSFLKEGQRNFWFFGEVPLAETKGEGKLSLPLASVQILEATHFFDNGKVFTKGTYLVTEIFDPKDSSIRFERYNKISKA